MAKRHMLEREIQRLEQIDDGRLEEELSHKAVEKFRDLLAAYRLAARVANRAFAFMKDETEAHKLDLEAALSGYAPEHFVERQAAECRDILIGLYDLPEMNYEGLREEIFLAVEALEARMERRS